jgi:CubicO group peptidase (beta-lactamase class C family)
VVFARGFHAHRSSVASVRKSLIGILYGIAVAAGEIDIHATLDALGIDDLSPLTAQEKQATVADLMKSRSGVYHPCVYGMEPGRPVRGSHAPGTFWYYNNWDFNALGTIYRQETGRTLAAAFREQVAEPLQMQDFAAEDVSDVFARNRVTPSTRCVFPAGIWRASVGWSSKAAAGKAGRSCRRRGWRRARGR